LRLGWIVLGFGVLSKGGSYGYLNNKSWQTWRILFNHKHYLKQS
jgi:hypothetical protein